ncbi:PRC-barrel domain-containing protein [Defluviimonas aestuarii]|uniref:PRC-barrel domain-containing protein n=1 Tax=Albidovulum aestuarii TaxID=1130726 RepID=UPI00249B9F8E|nr:PRC-barrel domain-containing protein [Defluviimonas aestuarii]MDI3335553.1 PRC-barrel domain-containing protein [Defluviimonas aestuarii]
MKKFMISAAFAALATTSAVAQDVMFRAEGDPMEIAASDFIGKRVYASEAAVEGDAFDGLQDGWEDIGEINDVILSRGGSVDAVLVDIGGFLGIGERQVAVDMGAIRFVSDSSTADDEADYFLVMTADRTMFEEAPEYHWGHASMEKVENAAAATAEAVDNAAEATAEAVDDAADATAEAAGEAADAVTREPIMRDGYDPAAEADLTTEMLTGAKAYDANDEWIGEVSRLIINENGKITHSIIDVGGFLGIGEKPVELAMGDVDILREKGGDDLRVYISMTREELEALPTYDK